MSPHTVVIDGIVYVPAGEVVLDSAGLLTALADQYMGTGWHAWNVHEQAHLFDDLFILVSEDSDDGSRESLSALRVRLSKQREVEG